METPERGHKHGPVVRPRTSGSTGHGHVVLLCVREREREREGERRRKASQDKAMQRQSLTNHRTRDVPLYRLGRVHLNAYIQHLQSRAVD
jgi:hypothetical protein